MKDINLNFTKSAKSLLQQFNNIKYKPELDVTPLCDEVQHQFYQQMVGILRLMIELGRIDISTEISLMSRYLDQHRIGHLIEVLNIFYFLIKKHNIRIRFYQRRIGIIHKFVLLTKYLQSNLREHHLLFSSHTHSKTPVP